MSGVKNLVQVASKGKGVPTNEQLKKAGTSKKGKK